MLLCAFVSQHIPDLRRQLNIHVLKLPALQKAMVSRPILQVLEWGPVSPVTEKPPKAKRKRQSSSETENQVASDSVS